MNSPAELSPYHRRAHYHNLYDVIVQMMAGRFFPLHIEVIVRPIQELQAKLRRNFCHSIIQRDDK
jgi:hypothetical protein